MQLQTLTSNDALELESWFKNPDTGNSFIAYYKNTKDWLALVGQSPQRHAFVAKVSDRMVGFVDIEHENEDINFAFGIAPNLRGQGFGRELLNMVLTYANDNHAHFLRGGVEEHNVACRKLLEAAGFSGTTTDEAIVLYTKRIS